MAGPLKFDDYAKEFSLRIELLRAVGEVTKQVADADMVKAQTLDQLEQTKRQRLINANLARTLQRIEDAERDAEKRLRVAERRATQLNYVAIGIRPMFLTTLDERLDAIQWLFGQAGDVDLLYEPLPDKCRSTDNFFCLSQLRAQVQNVPEAVDNIVQLSDWMRKNLHFYVAGSQVHRLFAKALVALADRQKAVVAEIKAKLADAKSGQFEKLKELQAFLKVGE